MNCIVNEGIHDQALPCIFNSGRVETRLYSVPTWMKFSEDDRARKGKHRNVKSLSGISVFIFPKNFQSRSK